MVFRILIILISLVSLYTTSHAFELAELESETTEELLLFFEAEELVIATRSATSVRKAPAIATVITAKEIRDMGARNLSDILRRVPGIGISVPDVPILYPSVEVRGIRTTLSEKVLLMIDGHSVNNNVQGSAVFSFWDLSVDNIKRIEVIRGPGSALYGANAFMAVINIVTKEAEDIRGLQVTAGGSSFDTQHYNLLFGHEGAKLKISASLDYMETDGPSSFIEQDSIGNSGDTLEWQERPDIGFNVSYGGLTLRGRYIKNRKGPYIGVGYAINDETEAEWQHGYLDLTYHRSLTEDIEITARLYGDHLESDPYWQIFPDGFPGYPDGMIGNPKGKERRLGGEFSTNYSFLDNLVTAGIMYEHNKLYDVIHITNYDPLTFAPLGSLQDISDWANYNKNVDRETWAFYVQDVWNIKDNMSLTAGIRHDHYSDFGGTTNPRAGFVWEFLKDTSLKLLYGSAFRAPSFTDLYHRNNPVNIGNPDLDPERIKTYEAGLERRLSENYTFRLNYFHNELEDLIVIGEKPSPSEPAIHVNKGSAEIDGIEAELLFDFRNDNYGYLNYIYQHPVDEETGQRKPDVPSQRANAGINLAPWKYLNTNISVSWTGKRYRDDRDTRDDLPDEALVDLTLIAKNFYRTLEIRGSVYNLFDEYYLDPNPFPGQVPNDYPTNKRMFLVEARYTF